MNIMNSNKIMLSIFTVGQIKWPSLVQATGVLCVFYNMWDQVFSGFVFVASVFQSKANFHLHANKNNKKNLKKYYNNYW